MQTFPASLSFCQEPSGWGEEEGKGGKRIKKAFAKMRIEAVVRGAHFYS